MSKNIIQKTQMLKGEKSPDAGEDSVEPFSSGASSEDEFHESLKRDRAKRAERMQAAQQAKQKEEQEKQAMLDKKEQERQSIKASPLAFHLFDSDEVDRRIRLVDNDRSSKAHVKCLQDMKEVGEYALLVPQVADYEVILDDLKLDYPNFEAMITLLRMRMKLNALKETASLTFGSNILLDGPKGVGKTSFLMALSEKMNTIFHAFSCASVTNSFDLTGLSSGYGTGRAGKLHELLAIRGCPNPIILLDEIEKAGSAEDKHNITGALYGLLEKNNAREFKDEFIDVKMDVSRINWFATSNHASLLDEALRDRFEVIQVRAPNQAELRQMIPRIYQRLLVEMEMEGVYAQHLDENMLDYLSAIEGGSIRQVKIILMRAMSCASDRADTASELGVVLKEQDIAALKREQEQAHERRMTYII